MPGLLKSLQIAFRSLRRRPLLMVVSVVTLGLGVGASAAIYSVLQATLLNPPPFANPDQLVAVWGVLPTREVYNFPAAPPQLEIYRREAKLIQDMAGFFGNNHIFRKDEGSPEQITSLSQTRNLFEVLGVKPRLGRDFSEEDARFNQSEVPPGILPPNNVFNPAKSIILSHDFWRSHFGSDPQVVGTVVDLDELPVEVIGVMPPGFKVLLHGQIPASPNIYEILRIDNENASMVNVFLNVIARLGPGVSLEQAEAELNVIRELIVEKAPILRTNQFRNRIVPLREELTQDIRTVVWVLAGAVAFILLIACANVSNLLLIRASDRRNEQFIRVALGSSRLRLVGESLAETGLLALAGALLGVGIAYGSLPALVSLEPQNIPQLAGLQIDLSILGFAALAAIAVTLLAGCLPAWSASGRSKELNLNVRGVSGESPGSRRSRNTLIIGEVALSFVLLIGAGLMARSFYELYAIDPGFETDSVLTFTYNFPANRYPEAQSQLDFYREFARNVTALPGVDSVGGAFPLPLAGFNVGSRYAPDLKTFTDGSARQAGYRSVFPGFFKTVGTPLLSGRTFSDQDQQQAAPYAVVNEALVDRTWPEENPLGKRIYIRGATPDPVELEVIGVIQNQKQQSLDEAPGEVVYAVNSLFSEIGFGAGLFWTVRVQGDPRHSVSRVESVLRRMDPEMPMQAVTTLQEIVDGSAAPTRFAMTLIGIFSVLATFLAAIGLYGVLAYRVRQKGAELSIRLTFGATRRAIFAGVLKQGLVLALVGLGIGLLAALGLTRVMTSLLVDVSPADPLTYVVIGLLFSLIAALSCLLPAYRATRVDPAQVLRQGAD